ncbi:MAG: hypothetical protein AVDCRST_MAG85-4102, partial [uncultured Solirubrobacteraceae bacterium]
VPCRGQREARRGGSSRPGRHRRPRRRPLVRAARRARLAAPLRV